MKTPQAFLATLVAFVAASFAQAPVPSASKVQDVTPAEAAKVLADRKDVTVLDLRTPDEFKTGHVSGAKNIDFLGSDFAQQIGALDKTKTYLIHCASGSRSTRALKIFEEQKFPSLLHLQGGFKAWAAAGQAVEK